MSPSGIYRTLIDAVRDAASAAMALPAAITADPATKKET
jgi:hypothetical protein